MTIIEKPMRLIWLTLACGMVSFPSLGCGENESLHEATRRGDATAVESILAKGADVNGKDDRGRAAIHLAQNNNNTVIVELLLAQGADVNATDSWNRTVLHSAVRVGQKQLAEILVAQGADVNFEDESGQTPLHEAAIWNQPEMAEFLLAKGADTKVHDNTGKTALDHAGGRAQGQVAQILRRTPAGAGGSRGSRTGGFGRGRVLSLLRMEEVRVELGIDDKQQDLIDDLQEETNEAMRDRLAEILRPDQSERFEQLRLQRDGSRSLMRSDVVEALGLSEAQRLRIRELLPSGFGSGGSRGGGGGGRQGGQGSFRQIREQRAKQEAEALGVLTDEQRANFQEMKGAEFEFPQRQWGRGRGGSGRPQSPDRPPT